MNSLPVNNNSPQISKQTGFTLVELMMTLFISIFIAGTVYIAYSGQHRTQIAQDEIIQLQQNLRAVTTLLSSEMRIANYKPKGSTQAVGLNDSTSEVNKHNFRFKWEDDANIVYDITYALDNDADNDGIADAPDNVGNLTRKINGGTDETILENVVAVEFWYTLADETDNNIYDPITTLSPTAAEINDIRAVTISVLARGERESTDKVQGPSSFLTGSGAVIPTDPDYRHRILITTVKLRNMGL